MTLTPLSKWHGSARYILLSPPRLLIIYRGNSLSSNEFPGFCRLLVRKDDADTTSVWPKKETRGVRSAGFGFYPTEPYFFFAFPALPFCFSLIAACAAASLAIGTRKGEQIARLAA